MTRSRRSRSCNPSLLAGLMIGAAIGLYPVSADAIFHIAHIQRVMTGLDGTTGVQFVEVRMDAAGQNLVSGTKLIAFDADGDFSHVVLTLTHNVLSGDDRSFLMASAAFAAEAGVTPDFVFDSTAGKGLPAEDGMVCWGKPFDQTDPENMIDCVSYGDFTGELNSHTSAPSPTTPFGHGLVRISDTGSSAADFECEDPSRPSNNAPSVGSIDASTPCGGECGNASVEEPETCDDGDTAFVAGDSCSADCDLVPCGIPTNPDAASPKTSDALFVLKAAVQSSHCELPVCDVNDSGTVTTSDALLILKKAVGQTVNLNCHG